MQLLKGVHVEIELVEMLRRFDRDPKRSPEIRADMTAVARWLILLVEQREHIGEIVEQKADLVKLGVRVRCEECRASANDDRAEAGRCQVGSRPPVWKTPLESLLSSAKRVGVELFEYDCASSNLRKFPTCLATLMQALARLQRYADSLGKGETKIELDYGSANCAECGRPIGPLPEAEP